MEAAVLGKPRVQSWAEDSWCVWTKWGRRPSFFHPTQELAETEAARLAAANPGKNYLVMHVISKFGAPRDRDASLAEDAKRLSPEGVAARAEGIAQSPIEEQQS